MTRPVDLPGRRAHWIARASLVVLVALVTHNVIWLGRNQATLPCTETLCGSPRDIEELAARSSNREVHGWLAIFYYLGQRIPGATVSVPEWMARHVWALEHVARLRVVVSVSPFAINPAQVPRLRAASTATRRWLRRSASQQRRLYQDLFIQIDRAPTDYVLAEIPGTYGPLFLLPRSAYQQAAP